MKDVQGNKVGIVTVHKNTNFGANLQAFALNRYINNLGYDCETIDYVPDDRGNHLWSWLKLSWDGETNKSFKRKIKLGVALLLSMGWKHRRLKKFYKFRKKNIRLSPFCKTAADVDKLNFDTVVCGSDQIWNPAIINGVDPTYWGDIDGVKKRISYAASLGIKSYEPETEKKIAELVGAMDEVSLREEDSARYIASISGKKTSCVCDPVFLLNKNEYEDIVDKRKIKGNYVLVYSIISNPVMVKIAEKYAEERGLQLIEICQGKSKDKHKQIIDCGPGEFLNLMYYADAVFTNSFHGTAFGIIFEKDLYSVNNKHGGSRIINLLQKAGISDRLIEDYPEKQSHIDYSKVENNMKNYIGSSKEFLYKALAD